MFIAGVFLLLIFALLSFRVIRRYRKSLSDCKHLPCMKSWHLIGDVPKIRGTNKERFERLMKIFEEFRESGLLCFWFGIRPTLYVFKDEYVQDVIGNTKHIEKSFFYKFVDSWLGKGLLTSTGSRWFKSRRMLTPSFHYNILNDFLVVMRNQSNILCNKLDKMVGKDEFNIRSYIANCTLDIITETAMGQCVYAQDDDGVSEYIHSVNRMTDIISYQLQTPWLWSDFIFNLHPLGKEAAKCLKVLHGFTNKVINDRKRLYLENLKKSSNNKDEESHGKKKTAFLDTLLDKLHEGEIDQTMLREEVDTFMFEGHDTTLSGISWTLYFIAAYPDVQRKLQKEVDVYYGENEEPSLTNLKKLVYLECVIKEVQRLYPSVAAIGRMAAEDFKVGPYEVKKGTTISIMISALHKDPQNFPDPERFDPDRFLTEDKNIHPYAFIPFSAGPRNCIGQKFAMIEEKVVLSQIIHRFNLETTQTREELEPSLELVLRPLNGIRIKFTHR